MSTYTAITKVMNTLKVQHILNALIRVVGVTERLNPPDIFTVIQSV